MGHGSHKVVVQLLLDFRLLGYSLAFILGLSTLQAGDLEVEPLSPSEIEELERGGDKDQNKNS